MLIINSSITKSINRRVRYAIRNAHLNNYSKMRLILFLRKVYAQNMELVTGYLRSNVVLIEGGVNVQNTNI